MAMSRRARSARHCARSTVTPNPIQDIYICEVIESGDKITTRILSTAKGVADPGKKIY